MENLAYKIAFEYLAMVSLMEKRKAIFNMLKDIKEGKIKNKHDFIILLKSAGITDKDLISIVQKEIEEGHNVIDLVLYLGEKGINFISKSWFVRNIDDKTVLKKIPSKYWGILREPEWVKQNI